MLGAHGQDFPHSLLFSCFQARQAYHKRSLYLVMTMRSFQDELTHFLIDIAPHLEDMTGSRNLIRYMQTRFRTVLAFFVIELILVFTGYRRVAAFFLIQPILVFFSICSLYAKKRLTEEVSS